MQHGKASSLGLLILWLGMGGFMMTHGWGKVQKLLNGEFEGFPDPMGIGSTPSLVGAVGAEFVCALAVALGFLTRFTAIPVVFTMCVAAFVVHADDPLLMGAGKSKEPALLYAIPFLALVFTGGGRFSVDAWLKSRRG